MSASSSDPRSFEDLLKGSSLYGPEPTMEELDAAAEMWEAATPTEQPPSLLWSAHPRDNAKQVASSETHSYVVTERNVDARLAIYATGDDVPEESAHSSVAHAMEEAQDHYNDQLDHIRDVADGVALLPPELQQLLWSLIWGPPDEQETDLARRICRWLRVDNLDDLAFYATMVRRAISEPAPEAASKGPWKVTPPVDGEPEWLIRKESGAVLARFLLQQDAEHCADLHNRHLQKED